MSDRTVTLARALETALFLVPRSTPQRAASYAELAADLQVQLSEAVSRAADVWLEGLSRG